MCVEVNVIYSLVAFVIIFLHDIFLALIICMYDGRYGKYTLSIEGCISHSRYFCAMLLDGTNNLL